MRSLSGTVPFALAGAITLAVGCGGDSTGPSAASVTGIAGDNQEAPTRSQLASPLSFTALGSSGQPQPGVRVTWNVVSPANGATFAPPTSTTDAQGIATTNVTLGGTIGDVVIRADVPGTQPVTFHALAVDPCAFLVPYTLGTTASGTLATSDCSLSGFFYDFYRLDLPAGQQSLRINMFSTAFDAFVDLYRLSGEIVGWDDDIQTPTNTNSQLDIILTSGSYVIGPNSYDPGRTGPYTMSATTRPASIVNCQLVWLTRGVTVTDAVATSDCADTVGGTRYFDPVAIYATTGTVLTINERSTAFDPKLRLFTGAGVLQVENDDSASGHTNAFIAFTVPADGPYVVTIGTSAVTSTGAYTLDVSSSSTLAGAAAAGPTWRAPVLLPAVPLRLPKGWPPLPGGRRGH